MNPRLPQTCFPSNPPYLILARASSCRHGRDISWPEKKGDLLELKDQAGYLLHLPLPHFPPIQFLTPTQVVKHPHSTRQKLAIPLTPGDPCPSSTIPPISPDFHHRSLNSNLSPILQPPFPQCSSQSRTLLWPSPSLAARRLTASPAPPVASSNTAATLLSSSKMTGPWPSRLIASALDPWDPLRFAAR